MPTPRWLRTLPWLPAVAVSLLLQGCLPRFAANSVGSAGSSGTAPLIHHSASAAESDELRGQIVVNAISQSGKNYRYGGDGPEDFDCSGLVRFVYAQVGLTVPRTTLTLFNAGEPVAMRDVRPADLLFYRFDDSPGPPNHVMIFIGNGEAIHAPAGGKVVRSAKVDTPGFNRRFIGARRLMD